MSGALPRTHPAAAAEATSKVRELSRWRTRSDAQKTDPLLSPAFCLPSKHTRLDSTGLSWTNTRDVFSNSNWTARHLQLDYIYNCYRFLADKHAVRTTGNQAFFRKTQIIDRAPIQRRWTQIYKRPFYTIYDMGGAPARGIPYIETNSILTARIQKLVS
jgi:hypothetical protein